MSGINYPTSQAFWGQEANIKDAPSSIAGSFQNLGELATCAAYTGTTYRSLIYDEHNRYVLPLNTGAALTYPICLPRMYGTTRVDLWVPATAAYEYSGGSTTFNLANYCTLRVARADAGGAPATTNLGTATSAVTIAGISCLGRYASPGYRFPSSSSAQFPTTASTNQQSWGYFQPELVCSYENTSYPTGTRHIPALVAVGVRNPTSAAGAANQPPGVDRSGVASLSPLYSPPSAISAARMRYAILAAQELERGAMLMWADVAPYAARLEYQDGGGVAQFPSIWQMWRRPHWVPFVDGCPLHVVTLADGAYTVNWRVGSTVQQTTTATTPSATALCRLEAPSDLVGSTVAGGLRYWLVQVDSVLANTANPAIYSESAWLGGDDD